MSESELIEKYVALAEETIRLQPESYLWTNRRWKLSRLKLPWRRHRTRQGNPIKPLTLRRIDHIHLSTLN